ncbi:sensor histidine kinase [Halobaculum limi]|uniref:sensor histidine kinase n=1 Tax=Halobaculum limi TaxID=3031916 RepID=UPI002406B0DA|nr:ATP-binding protein [Halobaculum sp. YSMS11]
MREHSLRERVSTLLGLQPVDGVGDGADGHPVRIGAALSVTVTGVVLAIANAGGITAAVGPVQAGVAVVGTLVSLGLATVGVVLYRSRFTARNLLRVAVWNLMGLFLLGGVMSIHVVTAGLSAAGSGTFLVANILAVGAAAHVIIGFYDVQRVRAGQLARERRKLAVLARVLRHNLRNDVNVVEGHTTRARDALRGGAATTDGGVDARGGGDGNGDGEEALDQTQTPTPDVDTALESLSIIATRADRLGGYAESTGRILSAYEQPVGRTDSVDLSTAVRRAVEAVRDRYPETEIRVSTPGPTPVRGDERVVRAVAELVENSCEHAGTDPSVEVTVESGGDGRATVTVTDDGDGIPADERLTVFEDAEITQTTHGTGLGLWTVKAAIDSCGGTTTVDGSTVTVSLPVA